MNIVGYSHSASEGEVLFKPGTKFLVNNVWEYQNGKIPAAAPPEAKMILFEFGTYQENGDAGYKAEFLSDGGLKGHKVKVIEVTEV